MSKNNKIDYGPLTGLIGEWKGNKGMDIAPEPDGSENNPYYETLTFTAIGDVTNAEEQNLAVLHYRQVVQRKSDDNVFHDETGYWMWDSQTKQVMHSLTIPRGVSLLAGGTHQEQSEGPLIIKVAAQDASTGADWQIIQSPFMRDKAKTTEFSQTLEVGDGKLSYSETMMIEIYGKVFEHTDQNELTRQ